MILNGITQIPATDANSHGNELTSNGKSVDENSATGEDETVSLGIDTTVGNNYADVTLFPKKESSGKVRAFGDLWKIVINNDTGEARVA